MALPSFFIDENLPAPVAQCMHDIFRGVCFTASHQLRDLEGTRDIPLIERLGACGFGAFITQDLKQLRIPEERRALRNAGMSWIGLPHMERRARGTQLVALQTSILSPVIGSYLQHPPQRPTAYLLKEAATPEQLVLREEQL